MIALSFILYPIAGFLFVLLLNDRKGYLLRKFGIPVPRFLRTLADRVIVAIVWPLVAVVILTLIAYDLIHRLFRKDTRG